MAITFFTPKITCSLITGGSALTGGGAIYYCQLPATWKELLVKEGYVFLDKDDEYKGMYQDQKDKDIWKGEDSLKNISTADDAKTKVKSYCDSKLDEKISSVGYGQYYSTKQKVILFCTIEGITTVKARLIQNGKHKWIEDKEDDKYKSVFAVYRYNDEFIAWLKEDGKNPGLSASSKVSDDYDKLKNKCESTLKRPYKEIDTNGNVFNYVSWWCVPLEHEKIEDRIKSIHTDWEKENAGEKIKTKWENTEVVTNQIKVDLSKNTGYTLQESDYSSWCSQHLEKQLSEDGSYKSKYIALMSACKKQS